MNLPGNEPKDGDFVAYLEQIERQQLAHLAPHGARETSRSSAATPKRAAAAKSMPPVIVGALVLGAIGLFLLMLGLFGDGGWIAAAIGAFLLWQAARALSAARKPLRDARAVIAAKFPSDGNPQ